MKNSPDIDAISARKQEIEDKIAILRKEADELDVALRVFQRFAEPEVTEDDKTKLGPPRPAGIPTLFDMTYQVIREAEQQGKKGLAAKEIVDEIGRRYWPGVQGAQILAPVYQMAKKGRFKKLSNGLFQTVRTKEPPAEKSESGSQFAGGVAIPPDMN